MKNEEVPPPCAGRATLKLFVILTLLVGASVLFGVAVFSFSKAARLADDIHDVKEDYDKVKGKAAENYKKATEAVNKRLDAVDSEGVSIRDLLESKAKLDAFRAKLKAKRKKQ